MKKATTAQARLLARIWASGSTTPVWPDSRPTVLVSVKNKWLLPIPNSKSGKFRCGIEYTEYSISEHGLLALENYLRDTRLTKAITEMERP